MLSMFMSIVVSFFSNPYVKVVKKEKGTVTVEIFYKAQHCGSIFITKDNAKFYLSYGWKSGKGLIKIEDFDFAYKKNILALKSIKNKKLLTAKCDQKYYDLITGFVKELRLKKHFDK